MTAKQKAFVRWYCSADVAGNGTEAARRAGYAGSSNTLAAVARENLRKPHIRKEVDTRISAATAGAELTIEKVLRDLESTYVRASRDGKYSAAIRCLELQGKYLGMFSRQVADSPQLSDVSTDGLRALLARVVGRGGIDVSELLDLKSSISAEDKDTKLS